MKLTKQDKAEAIDSLQRILEAIEDGSLDSTPAIAAAIEGAVSGLRGESSPPSLQ